MTEQSENNSENLVEQEVIVKSANDRKLKFQQSLKKCCKFYG